MLRSIVVVIALLLVNSQAWATQRWAGPLSNCGVGAQPACGNSSNDGLSAAFPKPLKDWTNNTLDVKPGDTIYVLPGDYEDTAATQRDTVFNPAVSGTVGLPVVYQSTTPQGAHINSTRDTISAWGINGKSYITIDGFYTHGTIYVMASDNIIVRNNEVTWGSWDGASSEIWSMVLQNSHDITFADNYVHDLAPRTNQPAISDFSGGQNDKGICIEANSYNNTIENNYVDGGGPQFVSYNGGVEPGLYPVMYEGIGHKGGAYYNNTIRRNIITGTRYGLGGIARTTPTSPLDRDYSEFYYENLIYNILWGGINADHGVWDWQVYNNTFIGCTASSHCTMLSSSSTDSSDPTSGSNRGFTFYNNIYVGNKAVYRREPAFNATYVANRATNLIAPWPTLTAGTAGSLATGTYWVRIAAVPAGGELGTGPSMPVDVTGPNGSITVGWDATANSPVSYNVYVGLTDEQQNTYVNVAATGAAGDPQSVVYTGTGTSTKAFIKSNMNQWQWPFSLTLSDYNLFYNNTNLAVYGAGGSVYAATLANWQTTTANIGNGGVNHGAYDLHSVSGDPLFVNSAANNYRIQVGSPAHGTGLGGVNMGAYPVDGSSDIGPRNGYWHLSNAGGTTGRGRSRMRVELPQGENHDDGFYVNWSDHPVRFTTGVSR